MRNQTQRLLLVIIVALSVTGCDQAKPSSQAETEERKRAVEAVIETGLRGDESERVDQTIAQYDELIRVQPRNADAFYERGLLWAQRYEHDKAIADITKAIQLAPTAEMYNERGWSWQHKDEYEKAVADYSMAIKLNPRFAAAYGNRGVALMNRGQHAPALIDCDKAIELDDGNAEMYNKRAYLRAFDGEYKGAARDYTRAIELDPSLGDFAGRGYAWKHLGKYQSAIDDLIEAIKLEPSAYAPMQQLADVYSRCPEKKFRDGEKAVQLAQRACELTNFKRWECLDSLASSYAESGEFEYAVRWQKKAVLITPEQWREGCRARLELYQSGKPFRD